MSRDRLYNAVLTTDGNEVLEVLATALADKARAEINGGSHILAAYLSDASRVIADLADELAQ